MAPVFIISATGTQTPGWVIPLTCVIYGAFVILAAFMIAKDISLFREKTLRKLPAIFQNNTALRRTMTALIILVPSLLWPVIVAITFPIIVVVWLVTEIQKCRERRQARRQTEQDPDLEPGTIEPLIGEHRQNITNEDRQTGESSIASPATAQVTEPPPAYTPYPSVLATLQTQWVQTSDRNSERYIRHLNNTRTPEEMLRSASRVTMIPRQ